MSRSTSPAPSSDNGGSAEETRRRTLTIAGLVHALHDGYTDAVYVFLPVWQVEFGLSYGFLGLLKGIYSATMATLQVPASLAGESCGVRLALALGTALAAMGY